MDIRLITLMRLRHATMETKICSKCKLDRDISCFYKSKSQKGGYQAYCRKCNLENLNKRYKTGDPEYRAMKSREYLLRNKYGLTQEDFLKMLKKQKGACAICGEQQKIKYLKKGSTGRLVVDHCHKTGKVRELLCAECNFGISKFKDKMSLLMKASMYIMKHNHHNEEQAKLNPK